MVDISGIESFCGKLILKVVTDNPSGAIEAINNDVLACWIQASISVDSVNPYAKWVCTDNFLFSDLYLQVKELVKKLSEVEVDYQESMVAKIIEGISEIAPPDINIDESAGHASEISDLDFSYPESPQQFCKDLQDSISEMQRVVSQLSLVKASLEYSLLHDGKE